MLLAMNDGGDDLPYRQRVLLGELEIAFVVCRDAHHRARAVVHQHVVGDPNRQQFTVEGIDSQLAGVDAQLFFLFSSHGGLNGARFFHRRGKGHHLIFQR